MYRLPTTTFSIPSAFAICQVYSMASVEKLLPMARISRTPSLSVSQAFTPQTEQAPSTKVCAPSPSVVPQRLQVLTQTFSSQVWPLASPSVAPQAGQVLGVVQVASVQA